MAITVDAVSRDAVSEHAVSKDAVLKDAVSEDAVSEDAVSEDAVSEQVSPNRGWTRADFSRRITPHLPRLYRLCLTLSRSHEEAEDLLQNSLVKAYLHRDDFQGRGRFVSWLYGIVRHEHVELARTHQRRRALVTCALERAGDVLDDVCISGRAADGDPEQDAMRHEDAELLLRCLRRLREPFRTVVHLCDVEGLGYEEVAQVVDAPLGTIKSRHARGRAALRAIFEQLAPER